MTITHVTMLSVPVSDPHRARDFYVDVLGCEVLQDEPMGPTMRWVQVRPPGADTGITLVTWFDSMPPGSLQGLMVDTPDLDAAMAEMAAKGVVFSPVGEQPWGRHAMFKDPDGNGLVLREPPRV